VEETGMDSQFLVNSQVKQITRALQSLCVYKVTIELQLPQMNQNFIGLEPLSRLPAQKRNLHRNQSYNTINKMSRIQSKITHHMKIRNIPNQIKIYY
jgi:hypothetical protein